jgi:hypothetical protein
MLTLKLMKGIPLGLLGISVSSSASETGRIAQATHVEAGTCAEAKAEGRLGYCVPALTAVVLATTSSLSSRTSKTGDRFGIVLTKAVEANGVVALPEGLGGEGEVVHAKSSGAGVGGELVLAARYLDLKTSRLKLRSMKTLARGKDQIDSAIAVSIISPIGGLFVRGRHLDIPAGAVAEAKTAEEVWIDAK